MTKKQKEMIKEAIFRVNNSLCDSGAWDNLFEDGENNTNAVIIGLIKEIEKSSDFALQVERLEDYMPEEVIKYAKYKNLVSGESVPDYEPLELFLDKVEYILKYEGIPDRSKWEYLQRYYINPLYDLLKELQDLDFEED